MNVSMSLPGTAQERALHEDIVILVDDEDRPCGRASKLQAHLSPGMLHRAFSVVIMDHAGRMLLQRRAACKPTFPNLLSNACCSHPLSNIPEEGGDASGSAALDGVLRAASRRVKHELRISIEPLAFRFITKLSYSSPPCHMDTSRLDLCEREIDYVLLYTIPIGADLPMKANPEEVSELLWVTREECMDLSGGIWPQLTPWCRIILSEANLWDLCRPSAVSASEASNQVS